MERLPGVRRLGKGNATREGGSRAFAGRSVDRIGPIRQPHAVLALARLRALESNRSVLSRRHFVALSALGAASCRLRTRCEPADADVIVIGAGLAGLAAAH